MLRDEAELSNVGFVVCFYQVGTQIIMIRKCSYEELSVSQVR